MNTPFEYYRWLRKVHKYNPRTAWLSTLMRFCNKYEYKTRVRRNSQYHARTGWNYSNSEHVLTTR